MLYYGDTSSFLENYCAAVTKKYCPLEKKQILNLTITVLFSFL